MACWFAVVGVVAVGPRVFVFVFVVVVIVVVTCSAAPGVFTVW